MVFHKVIAAPSSRRAQRFALDVAPPPQLSSPSACGWTNARSRGCQTLDDERVAGGRTKRRAKKIVYFVSETDRRARGLGHEIVHRTGAHLNFGQDVQRARSRVLPRARGRPRDRGAHRVSTGEPDQRRREAVETRATRRRVGRGREPSRRFENTNRRVQLLRAVEPIHDIDQIVRGRGVGHPARVPRARRRALEVGRGDGGGEKLGEAIGNASVSRTSHRSDVEREARVKNDDGRGKSLRNGVHRANGVVWEAVSPRPRRRDAGRRLLRERRRDRG
jgi:hypothetical protein